MLHVESPYLTQQEAAAYVKFADLDSFRRWAKSVGLRHYKPSRKILYRKDDIESAVENWQPSTKGGKAGSSTGQKMESNIADPLAKFRSSKQKGRNSKRN